MSVPDYVDGTINKYFLCVFTTHILSRRKIPPASCFSVQYLVDPGVDTIGQSSRVLVIEIIFSFFFKCIYIYIDLKISLLTH